MARILAHAGVDSSQPGPRLIRGPSAARVSSSLLTPRMPAVSVITTVFNDERYIGSCIDSVCQQSLSDFEMIVLDDGSTDGTAERLRRIHDPRIRVLSRSRVGRARALNQAIGEAVGKYVAILDSDDLAAPDRLESQVELLDRDPRLGLVGSAQRVLIDADGAYLRRMIFATSDEELRRLLFRFNPFNQSAITYRRSALESIGGFDETLGYYLDWDVALRIAADWRIGAIDGVASYNRLHPDQFFEGPNGVYTRLGMLSRSLRLTRRAVRELGAPRYCLLRPFARFGWSVVPGALKRVIVSLNPVATQHWRRPEIGGARRAQARPR